MNETVADSNLTTCLTPGITNGALLTPPNLYPKTNKILDYNSVDGLLLKKSKPPTQMQTLLFNTNIRDKKETRSADEVFDLLKSVPDSEFFISYLTVRAIQDRKKSTN
jgi:hypothetical protein